MTLELFADNPVVVGQSWSTLSAPYTAGATALAVVSNTPYPAADPTASPATVFRVRVDNEILLVTDNRTLTWVVAGAQEGSTAASHASGASVFVPFTKGSVAGVLATAASDATAKVATETTRAEAAEATAQATAIAAAATDATTKANAAQAAATAASQPLDSDLTAIAALTTTSFGRALLALADAAAGRTAFGLGTAATQASSAFDAAGLAAAAQAASQPVDSDLTAIAALTTTAYGRAFLALADAAAARTALALGTIATHDATEFLTIATASATYLALGAQVADAPGLGLYFPEAHGAVGDGSTNDAAAIQAAHDAAFAAGGGTVWLRSKTYAITSPLTWKSHVNLIGQGVGVSVIKPVGNVASAVKNITDGTTSAPLTDMRFENFEIDGSAQTTPGGVYDVTYKGFYFKFLKRCHWRNVYVHQTIATGFGTDFLVDCTFIACTATSCGRGNDGTQPGGAGFGFGCGGYASGDESVVVDNCFARTNVRHGIFLEIQSTPNNNASNFAKITNSHCVGNQNGIVNAGVFRFECRGNTVHGSTNYGIATTQMLTASLGLKQIISDNVVSGSGSSQVTVTFTGVATGSYDLLLQIRGNLIENGSAEGIIIAAPDSFTLREIAITNNQVFTHNGVGIALSRTGTTGAYVDVLVLGNTLRNNGMAGATNPQKNGIYLGANITRMVMSHNTVSSSATAGFSLQTATVTLTDSKIELNQFKGSFASTDVASATLTNSTITNNVT